MYTHHCYSIPIDLWPLTFNPSPTFLHSVFWMWLVEKSRVLRMEVISTLKRYTHWYSRLFPRPWLPYHLQYAKIEKVKAWEISSHNGRCLTRNVTSLHVKKTIKKWTRRRLRIRQLNWSLENIKAGFTIQASQSRLHHPAFTIQPSPSRLLC